MPALVGAKKALHFAASAVCAPFPSEVFPNVSPSDKDFSGLHAALAALPHLHALAYDDEALRSLPPRSRLLLDWLLLNPARRRRFTLVHLTDVLTSLRVRMAPRASAVGGAAAGGAVGAATGRGSGTRGQLPSFAPHNTPTYVLQVRACCRAARMGRCM
jgi:hypothetical protein